MRIRRNDSEDWLILIPIFVLGVLLTGCSTPGITDDGQDELDQIEMAMGFRPDVQFAPMYMMMEGGHARDEGLEIEITHLPETEAVELIAADELQFAIVSGEQVLLAREQGLPIVYVMAWWQDYPVAIATSQDSGIMYVDDLAGKRVGIPGLYGASYIGLRALLSAEDVDVDSLLLDSIGYTQVEALHQGLEDAVVIYANNEPVQLEALGMPLNIIRVADHVQLASNGIVTSERVVAENPELVRRLVRAFMRGLEETISDPDEAFEVSKLYVEGLEAVTTSVQRDILKESIKFWTVEQIGYSDPLAWKNMQNVLIEMGLLQEEVDLTGAYTNEFLE